ncbi:MAG: class I SAM-dependent methyltransferase [Candidatus Binatia bacterium]
MKHDAGKSHGHHKSRFHDPDHAAEFHRRSIASDMRTQMVDRLADMLGLKGDELVLDLATGTGRFARPLSTRLTSGRIIGIDQALAMLKVGHEQEEAIPCYSLIAGDAESLPFKTSVFDRAFVSFAFHHFCAPALVVREILRVLKEGGKFVVLDPVVHEAWDSVDRALEEKINQVFRRAHGEDFRFHTASSIRSHLTQAGFGIARSDLSKYSFDQDGMDGIPTGRHWLDAAEEIENQSPELAQRMREKYFVWERRGETVHVKGAFSYGLICAQKPA